MIRTFYVLIGMVFMISTGVHAVQAEPLDWPSLLETGERCSGLSQEIIMSVIWVESKGNPNAINVNGVGGFSPASADTALKILYKYNKANTDIGLMQVNYKTWGRVYGLKAAEFLDPQMNICIGSRILRDYIDQHKGSWRGVGRYNAVSYSKQENYASKVSNALKKVKAVYRKKTAAPTQMVQNQDIVTCSDETKTCGAPVTTAEQIQYGPPPQ